jgi:hypothetical protein
MKRSIVPAPLEKVMSHLAIPCAAPVILRRSAVEEIGRPNEGLTFLEDAILRLQFKAFNPGVYKTLVARIEVLCGIEI